MHTRSGIAACIVLLLFVSVAIAADFPRATPESVGFSSERLDRLDQGVEGFIEKGWIPGGAAVLARDGKIFYEKAFGYRDVLQQDPMEIDDIFRIASMSKPIIATAAMILFEEGRFLLTDPLSKYIPEFSNPMVKVPVENPGPGEDRFTLEPAASEITIYHLLTHTSGLPYGGPEFMEAGVQSGVGRAGTGTINDNILKLATVPLMHNPGERFTYGMNSDVLGYFIEVISGMPLDEFCGTRLFEPLGMTDTCFFVPDSKMDRFATIYMSDRDHVIDPESPQPPEEPKTMFSGGAGIRSTAYDYLRFAQMILNGGELDGVRILSPKTVAIMTTNQIGDLYAAFRDNSGDKYGLGFGIRSERGPLSSVESIGVLGWDGAHTTRFWIDPSEKLIGVFMYQISGEWRILNLSRNLTYQAMVK